MILTRLRIGQPRVPHGHFIEGRPASYCANCIMPLTVAHFMTECPGYAQDRLICLGNLNLQLQELIGEKSQRMIELNQVF